MTGVVIGLAVIAAAGGYAFACWFWPFGNCARCYGGGRRKSPSGKYWRPCKKCKGSGRRVRTGRRVWQWLAGQRDAAR